MSMMSHKAKYNLWLLLFQLLLRFTTLKGFRLPFLFFPEIKRILIFRFKEVILQTFLQNLDEVSHHS